MHIQGELTPLFYQIGAMLLMTAVVFALGFRTIIVPILGLLVSYALVIYAMGGFDNSHSNLIMAAEIGLILMVPVAMGIAAAAGIGALIHYLYHRTVKSRR